LEIIDGKPQVIFSEIVDGKKESRISKSHCKKEGIHINQTIAVVMVPMIYLC
jgi:hypothetical protein